MGQKVNPHGLRVGIIKGWDSQWFANKKDFADNLIEDYEIRKFLKKKLYESGIPKIEIKKDSNKVKISIYCAKPGRVIGEGRKNVEIIRAECDKLINKNKNNSSSRHVYLNIIEVKEIDKNAQLIAENVAIQLEKRMSFRRVMKQAINRSMNAGVQGIKIAVSGRLNGAEIARTEHYHEGSIPLQTLRANIDYGFAEANTTYGKIGVKVWIYLGEVLQEKQGNDKNQKEVMPSASTKESKTQKSTQR